MSPKFSGPQVRPGKPLGPGTTVGPSVTHEGGAGYQRDPETELVFLAATNMVGEDTFYESAKTRDVRYVALIHDVTKRNPTFIAGDVDKGSQGFARYLRGKLQMRSAAMVMACEYIAAGGRGGRRVIDGVCQRADEPAEALGYWLSTHGRRIPKPLKRGLADAATRLYNERNVLKYDGQSRSVRMGDVVDLVHPRPVADWQSALFRHLLDRRHNRPDPPPPLLGVMAADYELQHKPTEERREWLGRAVRSGWSWERLAGWLPGGMNAEAWEAVIPHMGYMALLRNLRNFDEANIGMETRQYVQRKLADPDEVARSRQFPYRFWSAWSFTDSVGWANVLENALEFSTMNIPALSGRTLVLIDTSGSMQSRVSGRSRIQRYQIGALFGASLAKRAGDADVVLFATDSEPWNVKPAQSILRYIDSVHQRIGSVGHGTLIHDAICRWWDGHDRVVVFTDQQGHDGWRTIEDKIPSVYVVDLAGYRVSTIEAGPGRYVIGGYSDAMFTLMDLLERGRTADWPW